MTLQHVIGLYARVHVCVPLCSSEFRCLCPAAPSWPYRSASGQWSSREMWQWVVCASPFHGNLYAVAVPSLICCLRLCFHRSWSRSALRSVFLNFGFPGVVCVTWCPQALPPHPGGDTTHRCRGAPRVSIAEKSLKPSVKQEQLFFFGV